MNRTETPIEANRRLCAEAERERVVYPVTHTTPNDAICENCGYPAGEHIRKPIGQHGYRCPTAREVSTDRANEAAIEAWKSAS